MKKISNLFTKFIYFLMYYKIYVLQLINITIYKYINKNTILWNIFFSLFLILYLSPIIEILQKVIKFVCARIQYNIKRVNTSYKF